MARRKYKNPFFRLGFLILAILAVLEIWLYTEPLMAIKPRAIPVSFPSTATASLTWPSTGQAALAIPTYGVFLTNGAQKAVPTASVAKIILALAVLKQKPLDSGQDGPTITLTQKDVDYYQTAVSDDGSVVPVAVGEQITQYQALEAMLLPSANNMAQTLADWAFGSQTAYEGFANNYVKSLGATNTHLADASGFDPATVSTATDLTKIADVVLASSVLSSIVSQYQANVPVGGTIYNTNWLLNTDGVIGIKTGNTDQAGGCFMFAANRTVQGQKITVMGTILDDYSLGAAIADARTLIDSVDSNFQNVITVHKGQTIATYQTPWGASTNAVAASDISLVVWKGQRPTAKQKLNSIKTPASIGQVVGSVNVTSHGHATKTNVVLQNPIKKPPLLWRLFRIKH